MAPFTLKTSLMRFRSKKMWRAMHLVFLLHVASCLTTRGVKFCQHFNDCRKIYVDSDRYRDVFVFRCELSTVYIKGTLAVEVHDQEGMSCRK